MKLIICLSGSSHKPSPSYLVDDESDDLKVVRTFKSTYKDGEYIPTIHKIVEIKKTETVLVDSLEEGKQSIRIEKELQRRKSNREITFLSDETIDKIIQEAKDDILEK